MENKEEVKNDKKSPSINISWLVYIALIVIGCVFLWVATNEAGISINIIGNGYVSMAVFLVYGFVTGALAYLVGKLIFGKIAGYGISYVNLFVIGLLVNNGKVKIYPGSKFDFSCKVQFLPKKERINYKLAHWGGTIALLFVLVLTISLSFLSDNESVRYFFLFESFFYIASFIINMIPGKMDHLNDGYILSLIKKENALDVYHRNLLNEHALLTDGDIEYCDYKDALDPLRMEGNIYNYYYLLDNNKVEEMTELASFIATNNKYFIEEYHISTALISKIFNMCRNQEFKELEDFYWKLDSGTRHVLTDRKNYESIKTSLYISTFIDVNYEEYHKTITSIEKTKKKYRYVARVDEETKLIEEVEQIVLKEHPEWAD
ncbi:MAG: hypothetical protein PUA56_06255 [Bacillales bacterium]|nr:hypothetical protein [Bacillales bacterium]